MKTNANSPSNIQRRFKSVDQIDVAALFKKRDEKAKARQAVKDIGKSAASKDVEKQSESELANQVEEVVEIAIPEIEIPELELGAATSVLEPELASEPTAVSEPLVTEPEVIEEVKASEEVVTASMGFVFRKAEAVLEKPEDYRPLANSWNVRQCEVSLARLYEKLADTIYADRELNAKVNAGFMTSLNARRDMNTATLLNTAFKSGLKLRATGKDEDGEAISVLVSSVSQLSSILYGLTDGDSLKEVIKVTKIAKATIEKLINSPGNASISTVLRIADVTGIDFSFENI